MRTSIMIRCGARQKLSQDELLLLWMETRVQMCSRFVDTPSDLGVCS